MSKQDYKVAIAGLFGRVSGRKLARPAEARSVYFQKFVVKQNLSRLLARSVKRKSLSVYIRIAAAIRYVKNKQCFLFIFFIFFWFHQFWCILINTTWSSGFARKQLDGWRLKHSKLVPLNYSTGIQRFDADWNLYYSTNFFFGLLSVSLCCYWSLLAKWKRLWTEILHIRHLLGQQHQSNHSIFFNFRGLFLLWIFV